MFSEYFKEEFPKRRMLQFKCREVIVTFVAVNWIMERIMVWSFRNITWAYIMIRQMFKNRSLFKSLQSLRSLAWIKDSNLFPCITWGSLLGTYFLAVHVWKRQWTERFLLLAIKYSIVEWQKVWTTFQTKMFF